MTPTTLRDVWGRIIREALRASACMQAEELSQLVPYNDLPEDAKEANRLLGDKVRAVLQEVLSSVFDEDRGRLEAWRFMVKAARAWAANTGMAYDEQLALLEAVRLLDLGAGTKSKEASRLVAKIYLAGRYSRRDELLAVATELRQMGHDVTSRWLETTWEGKDDVGSSHAPPEYREKHVQEDMDDVLAADWLVAFTEQPRSGGRGGRHVEYGIAVAAGKRMFVVGPRENIFHHLPGVTQFETIESFLKALQPLEGVRPARQQENMP